MYVKENFEIGVPILFFQSFNIDFGTNVKYVNYNNHIQYRYLITEYDIINICEMLEKGYSYRQITDVIVQRTGAKPIKVKNLLYDIATGSSMQSIASGYKIQKPKSEREPLFTESQIHEICKKVRENKDSYTIMNEFGYDLNKFDEKRKHCYINCISNIRRKRLIYIGFILLNILNVQRLSKLHNTRNVMERSRVGPKRVRNGRIL